MKSMHTCNNKKYSVKVNFLDDMVSEIRDGHNNDYNGELFFKKVK